MKSFRKNSPNSNIKQQELAERIADRIISAQTRMAGRLNRKTQHLSGQARLLLLIAFCVLFAAINLYLLIQAIYH